jgi:hypothetical protein
MSHDTTEIEGFPHNPRPEVRTETDWLSATDPKLMLRYLGREPAARSPLGRRKLRLFGVACFRRQWHLFGQFAEIVACVEFAEGYADGVGAKKRLKKVQDVNRQRFEWYGRKPGEEVATAGVASAARYLCDEDASFAAGAVSGLGTFGIHDSIAQTALLRCIFGNPFRPVVIDPTWRSETAVALATGIYADRAFDRLPILADALEEAGCDHPDVLNHCRQPDVSHARGCWVVDWVLGKG